MAVNKTGRGKLAVTRGTRPWLILGAVSLVAMIVNVVYVLVTSSYDRRYAEQTSELRLNMQLISASAREALKGNRDAFAELDAASKRFDRALNVLTNGEDGLPSPAGYLGDELTALNANWNALRSASNTIVSSRDRIVLMHEVASTLNQSIPTLQKDYDNVVDILLERSSPSDQVAMAQKQTWLAERISRNVDRMLQGGADSKSAADQFNLDANTFKSVLDGMLNGNTVMRISRVGSEEARRSLQNISKMFGFVSQSIDSILQAQPDLQRSQEAADRIAVGSPKILEQTGVLADTVNNLSSKRWLSGNTALIAFIVLVFSVFMIGLSSYRSSHRAQTEEKDKRKRQEDSIMQLLNELSDLAEGDLTTTATVTEEITGAIADSINYTIDQLRVLVSAINDTAVAVSNASEETRATALHLAEASEHQAQEIAGASAAVNEMAVTIDQVSANAQECSQVAERSVDIAKSGAGVVQNTIKGMDTIREQIQDTSKRIKRLGESSQEIGDIVSLINDIADQTNILALNAAIQASMAGDAGRGFAVVADEVQRLAERSSAATKQIEALVKTIQSDTNEAVISMEQTTAEVVRGARLAQDAGVALEEIESVSTNLAELIQNISNAARQQAASAAHISNTMNVIQEITSQTSAGTTATARSIGNLAELANNLRQSVAGFKLPEEGNESQASVGY